MRWFWLFILGLVVLTAGLYAKRVRTNDAVAVADTARETVPVRPRRSVRPARASSAESVVQLDPEPAKPEPEAQIVQREEHEEPEVVEAVAEAEPIHREPIRGEPIETESVAEVIEEAVETVGEIEEVVESIPEPEPAVEPVFERVEEAVEEVIQDSMTEAQPIPEAVPLETAEPIVVQAEPESSYERLGDGTIKINATGTIITGSGTQDDPFVLDWATMRSVERGYNPRAGKEILPDWLDVFDERFVRITGNTLVPVIATTTREVLVMQNPWDGCCIGIPPSPYDAIEVTLNHDVDFGNSAVGYGTVEGLFLLDPYVVDGWVLGLYLIEEATYRPGEGVPFPDF